MTDQPIFCVTDGAPIAGTATHTRVTATQAARDLMAEIRSDYGDIMFHQSGGCCDGSSPMWWPGTAACSASIMDAKNGS